MKIKSSISIVVGILVLFTAFFAALFYIEMKTLNDAYSDMNRIEFLSSTTQRLIGIAHSEHETIIPRDVFFINESTQNTLTIDGNDTLTVLTNTDIIELALTVVESWDKIYQLLNEEDINTIELSLARDSHYKSMTDLSNGISEYSYELNSTIAIHQALVMGLVFLIIFVMFGSLMRTHTELKYNKEIAAAAQIDATTGLHNRSRCQELLKNSNIIKEDTYPVVFVIDLNDLKKTNDSQGHRVGDELISAFAKYLKLAGDVLTIKPFLGRYGGDEFIVLYNDISSVNEINSFIKELDYLTKEFNDSETRFQLSYALGYSYANDDENKEVEDLSIRKLFDRADEKMYENKIEIKRSKDPDYDKKIEEGIDVR